MATYTTENFLDEVRFVGSIPTTTNTNNIHSSSNLLRIATQQLHIKLVPMILSAREEFYVTHTDTTLVANQAEYTIPARSIGQLLRDLQLIKGNQVYSVARIDREVVHTTSAGDSTHYYLRHNKVVMFETPNTGGDTLRMSYYLRPGDLVDVSDCAQITAIDTDTNVVTVSSIPSAWTTSTDLDLVSATVPYAFLSTDTNATTISGTDVTFSSLPDGLAVGDWISPAGKSPIPQLPREFMPILVQMTVVKALEAQGDKEGAKEAWKDLQTMEENGINLISPRNHGQAKKVVNRNWGRRRR